MSTIGEVTLAADTSALGMLHSVLMDAQDEFSDLKLRAHVSDVLKQFRKDYPDSLPRFESARLADEQRGEIARLMLERFNSLIEWVDDAGRQPLHDAFAGTAAPLSLKHHNFEASPGARPDVVYRGERWVSDNIAELGNVLVERGIVTHAAGEALAWIEANVLEDGVLDLSGHKIAVLGAGAEMAPTRLWLEAGADVLWIDMAPPPEDWFEAGNLSGTLYWPEGNADLLTQPQAIQATLAEFAAGDPIHLGLYAYAPGKAREMRLTASMNAIVDTMPAELIRSVTMLVSPTTPTHLGERDIAARELKYASRPGWERALAGLGMLGRGGGSIEVEGKHTSRTVVGIQGGSYQAAQYLGKILTAEDWAARGLRVSANTAAITRTRSLDIPVFAAAFGGAAALGVETMTPRQSRRINGLLAVRDWLHPDMPVPGEVRVHGGIHTLGYPLESALKIAAGIGFARSPRLLGGLFKRG